MSRSILALVIMLTSFPFCKSAKNAIPRPSEHYLSAEDADEISTITIPVDIDLDELVKSINAKLTGPLYEDYSYKDNGNDDMMMKAVRSRDITMSISGNTIRYRVPLSLWFKKNLYITEAEAEGELALAFKTVFAINPDWTLRTETTVEYHEWLRKPVLKTGIGDLSIESVANLFLNRNKRTLSQTIDRIVSQQLNLRPSVESVWKALQEPTLLSEEYKMWVKTTPQSIGMTPITTDYKGIHAKIAVECYNDVSFGDKPSFRTNSNLPNLTQVYDPPESFQMHFAADVPFSEAERLAKTMVVGQVFESGKRKAKIEDIRLWGSDDRIVVDARLSGSYEGDVYFIGRPIYNREKNQIEVTDLDFHTDTENFLHKSAAWLFSGPIKKRMRDSMVFPLHQDLADLKQSVQESLVNYVIQPGVTLNGQIDSIGVEGTRVTARGLRVDLYSEGRLKVDVKGF